MRIGIGLKRIENISEGAAAVVKSYGWCKDVIKTYK
jgi:hypothetical protein